MKTSLDQYGEFIFRKAFDNIKLELHIELFCLNPNILKLLVR